ncbi:MAG: DHH family phosphoesterase [Isosphaeraceae bacterium]|nr:DHH family phosphoesterase [Isosphaeraceae bacterium]
MSIDWTHFETLIDAHDRFVVTTHVRPDGDALGSEVGMVGLLRQRGKDVVVVNASRTPPRYDFLDPEDRLFRHWGTQVAAADLADREALVILDLSAWSQLGEFAEWVRGFAGKRIVVDHHVSQDDLGAEFFKDTSAEATGTLVYRAVKALGASTTREMATGLLTAIAMDTGWFRHPNTKPSTLATIGELVEAGAEIDTIHRLLFERNSLGRLKMMGETLASLSTDLDGRIAYASVTREDFARTGAIPADTEDLVDFTVSLRGVDVGILFIEQPRGGIKLSIRSRNGMDCAKVAAKFQGGGHRAAAGATVSDPLPEAIASILAAVREELGVAPA